MHSKTEGRKGPSDVHFSFVMRHVNSAIETMEIDVVTPTVLVNAINGGDIMKGCIGLLYNIDLSSEMYKKWLTASKDSSQLVDLGRVNIFKFKYLHEGRGPGFFNINLYQYKYTTHVLW